MDKANPSPVFVSASVEGIVDEAVVRRLILFAGGSGSTTYGMNGKWDIRRRIEGYNNAARYQPWLVLVDLNHEFQCAPLLRRDWLSKPSTYMCFRIAVREVETWLLADRAGIARFLGVSQQLIDKQPEQLEEPKRTMVNLASKSRRRAIRDDMIPRRGSGIPVGPAYTSRLIQFATGPWSPENAMNGSDSLRRCVECLTNLIETWRVSRNS
jgi:hypothetical protein